MIDPQFHQQKIKTIHKAVTIEFPEETTTYFPPSTTRTVPHPRMYDDIILVCSPEADDPAPHDDD